MKYSFLSLAVFLVACTPSSGSGETPSPVPETPVLEAPLSIKVETVGPSAARLSWETASKSIDYTIIERNFSGGDFESIANIPEGETTYIDRSLRAEGSYSYRLRDSKGDAYGPYSEVAQYEHKAILPAPSDLSIDVSGNILTLSWKDNCVGEEGYIVSWSRSSSSTLGQDVLGKDSQSWSHEFSEGGKYSFAVVAYKGSTRSQEVSTQWENMKGPSISVSDAEASWWAAKANVTVLDDGGEACEVGLCWKESGIPSVEDNCSDVGGIVRTGAKLSVLAEWLTASKTYHFRAWARNGNGLTYGDEFVLTLKGAPSALKPDWTDISSQYGLPEGVSLYKSVTSVTGRSVNIWYASLDKGAATIRTPMATSLTTPGDFVKSSLKSLGEVCITVNGGYFGAGPVSYSFVRDCGVQKAKNISSLTRTQSYSVTRGAFGVDEQGNPSIKWIYANGDDSWCYDTSLPVVDGNPALKPTSGENWDIYSGIGGAPILLKDGVIPFDYMLSAAGTYVTNHDLLQADIFKEDLRAPRTAIGYTPEGKIIILVCDGRNSGGSAGLTLDELARIMKGLGCSDALNLDGGGSSAILAGETLLNSPSDGVQRKVLSFVSIIK